MSTSGLPNFSVRLDGNLRSMHHKVIIIDRVTVILGSFNYSEAANSRNDENVLIVHDPTFATFFVQEFETVWAESAQ
jgi:phosphatidylserine/phosphatidylglycerophosphate/cardiolipin synthase-like enzyme